MWEDVANKNGGRFMMRIKRKYANMYIIIITCIIIVVVKHFVKSALQTDTEHHSHSAKFPLLIKDQAGI